MARESSDYTATAKHGMVTASHPLAARAGLDVLTKGGNAVDAAVATAFALTVVDPCMCSIAGRGEMNLYHADDGTVHNVEFIAVCGEKAHADMFQVLPGAPGSWWQVKDDANAVGYASICVPTALAGLCTALDAFGTWALGDVVAPAIRLAATGFPVDARLENTIDNNFEKLIRFPATAKILCPQGRPLMRGETLTMKDYARTLQRIAEDGPDVFYTGDIAAAIVTDLEAHGGLVTANDLAAYQATIQAPTRIRYRDYEVIAGAPDCSGGRLVQQSLNILENFDLKALGDTSPAYIHLLAEAFKRAFADRLEYEADPKFTAVPRQGLLSKAYARALANQIPRDAVTPTVHPGDPWRYEGQAPQTPRGAGLPRGGSNTTHLCAADAAGNMVALTITLCGGYGSGVVIPDTGLLMNNGMYWFNPLPGRSNSIQPGKRHVANMAATLVLQEGDAVIVTGAAGGRRILTTVTEMLIHALDFYLGAEAVALPRFHVEAEEPLQIEQAFFDHVPLAHSLVRALTRMGHRVETMPRICVGCMITRDPETGLLHGSGEPRQQRHGLVQTY